MNDINEIFEIYQKFKNGSKTALNKLFDCGENGEVLLHYDCLKNVAKHAEQTFNENTIDTKGKHKKFYAGKYDTSDSKEILYLLLIEIYSASPNDKHCIKINGVTSRVPIVDGVSLMRNIYYFVDVAFNARAKTSYKDISENAKDNEDNEISLIDNKDDARKSRKRLLESCGEVARQRLYVDALRLFKEDIYGVFNLFNSDSIAIKAVIKTILEREESFEEINGGLNMIPPKEFCDLVESYTGVHIWQNNLGQCFGTIKERILEYLLIAPDQHKYLFCMDDSAVFKICENYMDSKTLLRMLYFHDEFLIDWKYRYDKNSNEINLINGNVELLSEDPERIASEMARDIVLSYKIKESRMMISLSEQYCVESRLSDDKIAYWDVCLNRMKKEIKLLFYTTEFVRHPIEVKLSVEDITVFEGFEKFYICSEREKKVFILPKNRRKKIKINKRKIA